jgi:peptide/nickel transport system substrate-binding protein
MFRLSARKATSLVAALAIGGFVMAACGSGSGSANNTPLPKSNTLAGAFGVLPTAGTGHPINGGTVSIAEQPGAGPNWIFPITPAANASVFTINQFQAYMWRPLWWAPVGATPEIDYTQSIAQKPVFSNDNKTVTIKLNSNWKWSDGQPVTSKDVLFYIDEVEAAVKLNPANFSNYTPGLYPDFFSSVTAPDAHTVVLNIKKTYNQDFLFLDELALTVPLPWHAWAKTSASGPIVSNFGNLKTDEAIYNFLASQAKSLGTYTTNPLWQVVDGPFKLKQCGQACFDPATGGNKMVPNPNYSGPAKAHIAELDNVAFTSISAEFNQLLTGQLTVGFVDFSDLPQVSKLKAQGYTVWGYPDYSFSYMAYNFKDTTGNFDKIIGQLYVRQALAMLQNEKQIVQSRGAFDGAAGEAYGPVPAIPAGPFAPKNALNNPFPYNPQKAATILKDHGWNVQPGGTTTCQKAGSGPNECGAGIPAGTPLSWNVIYGNSPPVIATQVEQVASVAKQYCGINMSLKSDTFNYIIGNLSDASNPDNVNKWAMQDFGGFTDSLYPTTNELFNTTGSYNIGGYSDPTADKDINASVNSLDNNAVYDELSYITAQQPGMFQPNADLIFAFKTNLHGPAASFADASQYQYSPEYWYFTNTGK